MRVLITQSAQDATATAAQLTARGHEVLAVPLVTVERVASQPNLANAQGFLATSPEGARALADAVGVRTFPVFAESEVTAGELRRLKFSNMHVAKDDSQDMARMVERTLKPAAGALVYACSTSAAIQLSALLGNMGFAVRMLPLFAIKRVTEMRADLKRALESKAIDAALFLTADEARAFTALTLQEKMEAHVATLPTVAATPIVAAPLRALTLGGVTVPTAGDIDTVFSALDEKLVDRVGEERRAREQEARAEAERIKAEEERRVREKEEAERQRREAEEKARAEAARLAAEKAAAEQAAREKSDAERRAKEEATRIAREQAEAEKRAREEAARAEAERKRLEKLEAERAAAERKRLAEEQAAKDRAEKARLATEKAEQERVERERAAAEKARLAAEKAEQDRLERERAAAEKARIAAERAEAERIARERAAAEKAESDRIAREEAAKQHAEKIRLAAEKAEQERIERERLAQERAEQERIKREQAEAARAERERIAAERAEADRIERERRAKEKADFDAAAFAAAEQAAAVRAEKERLDLEQAEQKRLEEEKLAAEKAEQDRIAAEHAAAARAEKERIALELAEQKRLEKEKLAAEKAERERIAREENDRALAEQTHVAQERAEVDRIARERAALEKAERARLVQEEKEQARIETVRLKAEAAEARRAEENRRAAEKAEHERLKREQAEAARVEKVQAKQAALEKAAAEKAERKARAQAEAADRPAFAARIGAWFKPRTVETPDTEAPDTQTPEASSASSAWDISLDRAKPPSFDIAITPTPVERMASSATMAPVAAALTMTPDPDPPQPKEPDVTSDLPDTPLSPVPEPASEPVRTERDAREQKKREAPPITGGRAARLQAEDAADHVAARERFRHYPFSGETPDTNTDDEIDEHAAEHIVQPQPPQQKRSGSGRVVAVFVVLAAIVVTALWALPRITRNAPPSQPIAQAPTTTPPAAVDEATLKALAAVLAQKATPTPPAPTPQQKPAAPAAETATPANADLSATVAAQAQQLAAQAARIATLEAAIGNGAKVDELARDIKVLEAKSAQANSVLALSDRVTSLETTSREAVVAHTANVALLMAIAQWRDAMSVGKPFALELETVKAVSTRNGGKIDDSAYAGFAARGIPTLGDLQRRFGSMAAAAVRADAMPANATSWSRRIYERMLAIITIRRIDGDVAGTGTQAVLARAERRVNENNLAAATDELNTLSGPAAGVAADWLNAAKARVAAEQGISDITTRAVAALAAGAKSD